MEMDVNSECNVPYVINLIISSLRMEQISQKFQLENLDYRRFEAVDGYKIKFTSVNSGQFFFGEDLKNKNNYVKDHEEYKVTCNPGGLNETSFYYRGNNLNAGEYGVYCSNYMIWQDLSQSECSYRIIFEDDVKFRVSHFSVRLFDFIKYLPNSFSVAWFGTHGAAVAGKPAKEEDTYIKKDGKWWDGLYGYVVSKNAAIELMKVNVFSFPADVFLSKMVVPDLYPQGEQQVYTHGNLINKNVTLEGYVALENFLDLENVPSTISETGRSHHR